MTEEDFKNLRRGDIVRNASGLSNDRKNMKAIKDCKWEVEIINIII